MSEIKKGALVKAWDDDASEYIVGEYLGFNHGKHAIFVNSHDAVYQVNAIPLPPELAKQLEELGK